MRVLKMEEETRLCHAIARAKRACLEANGLVYICDAYVSAIPPLVCEWIIIYALDPVGYEGFSTWEDLILLESYKNRQHLDKNPDYSLERVKFMNIFSKLLCADDFAKLWIGDQVRHLVLSTWTMTNRMLCIYIGRQPSPIPGFSSVQSQTVLATATLPVPTRYQEVNLYPLGSA